MLRIGVPRPWHPAWWEGVQEPRCAQCAVSLMTICPCSRSPPIVTLLRGTPNAGHDPSTQSPLQNCNRALGPAHSVYTALSTQNEVSQFQPSFETHSYCSCSWCVVVGGPGRVSRYTALLVTVFPCYQWRYLAIIPPLSQPSIPSLHHLTRAQTLGLASREKVTNSFLIAS